MRTRKLTIMLIIISLVIFPIIVSGYKLLQPLPGEKGLIGEIKQT